MDDARKQAIVHRNDSKITKAFDKEAYDIFDDVFIEDDLGKYSTPMKSSAS